MVHAKANSEYFGSGLRGLCPRRDQRQDDNGQNFLHRFPSREVARGGITSGATGADAARLRPQRGLVFVLKKTLSGRLTDDRSLRCPVVVETSVARTGVIAFRDTGGAYATVGIGGKDAALLVNGDVIKVQEIARAIGTGGAVGADDSELN